MPPSTLDICFTHLRAQYILMEFVKLSLHLRSGGSREKGKLLIFCLAQEISFRERNVHQLGEQVYKSFLSLVTYPGPAQELT